MRAGSLFSGVGGMDLGLARAGIQHSFFAESDSYRRDVLRARWPGVPVYDDVRDVGIQHVGPRPSATRNQPATQGERERAGDWIGTTSIGGNRGIGLLCGGFPCQDLSVAGQRRGLAGARSGLFHEFARIADALRPQWILVENVPGLLSSNGGRDFGIVLGTLADIGYGLGWRVLDSRFFGVPQRRRRVFIVGALADRDPRAASERAGQVLAVGTRCPRHSAARGEAREDVAVASLSGLGTGCPDDNDGQAGRVVGYALNGKRGNRDDGESETFVTYALTSEGHDASEDGPGRGTPLVTSIALASDPIHAENLAQPSTKRNGDTGVIIGAATGVRRLTPTECERLQAWPDGWTQLGNTADSKRYAACGDGVTATVAEWIGRRLMNAHSAPAEDGGPHRKETEPSVPSP